MRMSEGGRVIIHPRHCHHHLMHRHHTHYNTQNELFSRKLAFLVGVVLGSLLILPHFPSSPSFSSSSSPSFLASSSSRASSLVTYALAVQHDDSVKEDNGIDPNDKDFYRLLKINRDASQQEVKKAYRRLTLQYHPDKAAKVSPSSCASSSCTASSGKTAKDIEKIFQAITEAYEALSDKRNRELYDVYGADEYSSVREYYDKYVTPSGGTELYGMKKGVTLLSPSNYERLLADSSNTWVVLFYHPHCGSCRQAVPWFGHEVPRVVSESPGGKIRIGTMNCGALMGLCHEFGVDYMGQIRVFPEGQERGAWYSKGYEGPKQSNHLIQFALSISPLPKLRQVKSELEMEKALLNEVQNSSNNGETLHSVGIIFYSKPTCPPCRTLKQQLPGLLNEIGDVVEVMTIDCSVHHCDSPYYPYLKVFYRFRGSSFVNSFPLNYDGNVHPGGTALRIAAQVLREVSGFSWTAKKEKDGSVGGKHKSAETGWKANDEL